MFEAAKVMNGEVYPIAMTAKSAFFYVVAYAEQESGKRFMEQDSTVNFSVDDFRTMIDFYCRLINEKVMPQVEYFDRKEIGEGKYAGCLAWLSDGSAYFNKAIENGYEYVVADYPTMNGVSSGTGWYAKPATMYAVSKNTVHPQQAAMLLDFLLNSDEMAELQATEKGIPLSTAAREYLSETGKLEGMQYKAFEKMQENGELAVLSPYFENDDMIDEFRSCCNAVLFDKETAESQAQYLYDLYTKK